MNYISEISKKEALIRYINCCLIEDTLNSSNEDNKVLFEYWRDSFHQELLEYIKPKSEVTEIGAKILHYMRNQDKENLTAKTIAEGLFLSSRSVSSAMQKLIKDGFIIRQGVHPTLYALSDRSKDSAIIEVIKND